MPSLHHSTTPFLLLPIFLLLPFVSNAANPKTLFSEDFSSGASAIEKWSMKDRSSWKITADGRLASVHGADGRIVGCGSKRFRAGTDVTYSFEFNLRKAEELNFKINHFKGGHIYRLIVNPRGFFLRINTNKQIPIVEAVTMERLVARIAPDTWHAMTIVQEGDRVTASIPGVGSKTWHSSYFEHPIATIGLSARGGEILFDNIEIKGTPLMRSTGTLPPSSPPPPQPAAKPTTPTPATPEPPAAPAKWLAALDPFLSTHCYECHDDVVSKGDLDLFSLSTDVSDPETLRRWVRIFDRVDKGEMPPKDKPRPGNDDQQNFLALLEPPLIAGHQSQRETVLRRLNRAEYENTIEDLFGIKIRLRDSFPADAKKHGFDNNGEGLTLSSELIQLYLDAANQAFDRAIGPATAPEYTKIDGQMQDYIHENMYGRWQKLIGDGRGTIIYSSEFGAGSQMNQLKLPEPGTYRWRFHAKAFQSEEPIMMQIQTGILTRQGDKRFMGFFEVPPSGRVVEFTDYMQPGESAYPRPFGTLKNISGFIGPNQGKTRGLTIHDYKGAGLLVERFEIEGPIDEWPPPSRKKLLGDIDLDKGTLADAETILEKFLPRAFRRPVTAEETAKYCDKVVELMDSGRSFEESLRWTVTAALCSPDFLFLEEPSSGGGPLRDYALANRLSYYLWSSMPDEELFDLAASGKLADPSVLSAQTERLLSHEKSKAFTENFAYQWLHLREIDATSPDTKLFPDFDVYLKHSMVRESEEVFETVLEQNRSIRAFVDSNWVMVNERLARHYDIPDVKGEAFREVKLPAGSPRGGIMTHASVLKVTANGANTSPVERGVWILENLLGIHPPPPPPSVPAVVPDVTGAKTLRQLLDAHRNEERCQGCHQLIDPPGFALESFDPIGAWRTRYAFQGSKKMLPVDATGVTDKGEPFKNVRDYKRIIMSEIDQVTYGLTEKLLTYGTGRAMGFSDRAELHRLVSEVAAKDYRFRDLIHATVQSSIFHQP